MRLMAIVLMLASACGGCGAVDSAAAQDLAEIDAPAGADQATAIVLAFYAEQTGIAAPAVTVHWTADAIPFGSTTADGLTWSCDDIWVHARADGMMPLALSHELGHCMLRTLEGDGDAAHAIAAWWGDGALVDRAHVAVRAAGL